MRLLAHEAERVVSAKIEEDFSRAVADPSLAAATASFGRTTVTRLAALREHQAYNRARGFNIDDVNHLPAICAFYTEAGLRPRIEVWAGDASASLEQRLGNAGFHPADVNITLQAEPGRPASSPAAGHRGIEVRELAAGDDDTLYLDILFEGYGLDTEPVSSPQTMMAIEHRSPHLRRYLAYVNGHPAAAAALYTTADGSYFAGAATIPAMRNQGCQSALIRRRLHDAAATAHPVVVTTALASPSQANLQRFGFRILHTRRLWHQLAAAEQFTG